MVVATAANRLEEHLVVAAAVAMILEVDGVEEVGLVTTTSSSHRALILVAPFRDEESILRRITITICTTNLMVVVVDADAEILEDEAGDVLVLVVDVVETTLVDVVETTLVDVAVEDLCEKLVHLIRVVRVLLE